MVWLWLGVGWVLAGLVAGLTVAGLAAAAPALVRGRPRSLGSLYLSMAVTAVSIVAVGAGLLALVVLLLGYDVNVLWITALVAGVGVVQWLVSPWLINMLYRVRPAGPELSWLEAELERISRASGLRRPPRLVVAEMDAPNAFAYGSPLAGYYVAVTRGLLRLLPRDEVVAVIGHEVGHLRHRDVQAILALSLLPSIAYYLGRVLVELGLWGAAGGRREDRGVMTYLLVGVVLVAASVLLHFLVRHFNRLREYYADAHSALVTGAPRSLARALARIHAVITSSPGLAEELHHSSAASMLFIYNALVGPTGSALVDADVLVERLKRRRTSAIEELFSTHPPIEKRLAFLEDLERILASRAPGGP